ncbi:hypothetical protein ACPV5U_19045 [Vibrio mediterranei]
MFGFLTNGHRIWLTQIISPREIKVILRSGGIVIENRAQARVALELLKVPVMVNGRWYERWQVLNRVFVRDEFYALLFDDKVEFNNELENYARNRICFSLEQELLENESVDNLTFYELGEEAYALRNLEVLVLTPNKYVLRAKSGKRSVLIASKDLSRKDAKLLARVRQVQH